MSRFVLTLFLFALTAIKPVHADPTSEHPGNYVPPPSYSHWIYWTPTLHRLRVEHHAPPLQSVHVDPPTPATFRIFVYPKPPVAPGALFHPSSTPFMRVEPSPVPSQPIP